ncbi:MAG: hypothetical protein KDA24_07055 [Deltaproteobacteria bacterium]|nr:hypothetical protein [Deltaproteobacteria bacterium]
MREPDISPIELRTVPRMRVARLFYAGSSSGLGPALKEVEAAARLRGVGPVGVAIALFPAQATASLDTEGRLQVPTLHAELRVPVSNTAESVAREGGSIEFVRVDRFRAACRVYSGPVGVALRHAQEEMFAWIDDAGLVRHGTRHHHAYMPNVEPGEISLEIRVPVSKPPNPVAPPAHRSAPPTTD